MANLLTWIGIVGVLGCGSKAGDSSGSGSAAVAVAVAQDSATAGSGAGSGSGSGSAAAAACLPDDRGLAFGYIGRDLVTCMADDGTHTCWTIDRATGHVTPRAGTPVPGVGFGVPIDKLPKPNCLGELCWPAATPDPDRRDASYIYVAYNPDGKRAVVDADPTVYIFDLATKKVTSSFDAGLGNSLHGLWFVGDTVMVSGADAGPYAVLDVYTPKGKKLVEYQGFYEGGLGVGSDGRAILQQTALEDLAVLDGKTGTGKSRKRKLPNPNCNPHDPGLDSEAEDDPKAKPCIEYRQKYFDPYSDAIIIDDGANFLGSTGDELFVLDGKTLAELSRVKLAVCAKPPGTTD